MNRKTFQTTLFPVLAAVAVLALLVALPMLAQPGTLGAGPGPGHHMGHGGPGHAAGFGHGMLGGRGFERLADALELTDAQRTAARAIHEATRAAVEPIKEQSRSLHEELRGLLEETAPDAAAVGERVIALDANRAAMRQLFADARADFEALLTADQLETLEKAHERRGPRGDRRQGRRGPK